MMESRAIQKWRALTPEAQRRLRLLAIPDKVARSMAFEGEPVSKVWVEAQRSRLLPLLATSKPPKAV